MMTTIGTFTQQDDTYIGTLRTLTLEVQIRIAPTVKESGSGPDFRVYAGLYELGAAWKRTSKADQPYLSVTLDDPVFPERSTPGSSQPTARSSIWYGRGVAAADASAFRAPCRSAGRRWAGIVRHAEHAFPSAHRPPGGRCHYRRETRQFRVGSPANVRHAEQTSRLGGDRSDRRADQAPSHTEAFRFRSPTMSISE
jgi:uncharacterized protein (DUF736 family)